MPVVNKTIDKVKDGQTLSAKDYAKVTSGLSKANHS